MTIPEFSRPVRIETIGVEPRRLEIEAIPEERAALAGRFGLVEIGRLAAEAALTRRGEEIVASGRMIASVVQSCVATAEPVEATLDEPFEIVFRPTPSSVRPDEEVELDEAELDVVFYEGGSIDLGEAVAETLSLGLDPFPRAPGAAEQLKAAGVVSEEEAGPFGALAGLRDRMRK
jgi:uncharacterized metal-binding protein YceD (DUF177 family)